MTIDKDKVRGALLRYIERYPSQNKAAASLKGVSAATVSAIVNGKYDMIGDDMWKQVASQVGCQDEWVIVETSAFVEMTTAFADAQELKNVMWIVGEAGCGKTTAGKTYAREHKEVFYVQCSEELKRGDFLREIARVVGVKVGGGASLSEMWHYIIDGLISLNRPLLIFDEADKLSERVFQYFVSMYNKLEEHAGIIFMSTDYICRRMENGLRYEKMGYKELFSRIGRKYFVLDPARTSDVAAICRANGVTDEKDIRRVLAESGTDVVEYGKKKRDGVSVEYDFRRVKKSVKRTLLLKGNV
jgi:DNA transposition AAA+ family ATPase